MDENVKQELDELEAIAQRVVRREAANERDREEIRRRLPALRAKDVGPAQLERTIHSVFVAGTISRWTKGYAKSAGKPGRKPKSVAS